MTTKYTKGPWHIANGVQIRSNRDQIAKIWMMRDGEGRENARLIAAAPTMHEYIAKRADAGDNEAKQILESINAGR